MATITRRNNSELRRALIRYDKAIRAELRAESYQTAKDVERWLKIATRTWSPANKPKFKIRVTIKPLFTLIEINPDGQKSNVFIYVDQGTGLYGDKKQAYLITPKEPGGMLKFRTGYSAKTAPVAKINVGTGQATGDWVSTPEVLHPGIKGRKFTDTVINELKPDFRRRINNALRRAVNKTR